MISKPRETVFFILDYFDGPIVGIAGLDGSAHYFSAELDEEADSYTNRFALTPLSDETMTLVLAARTAWWLKKEAGAHVPSTVEEEWQRSKASMDHAIEQERAIVPPRYMRADFSRTRDTGTDADSFVVTWTDDPAQ